MNKASYYIGVDGGGSGTRIRVLDHSLKLFGEGHGDSSALSQGQERAWSSILNILEQIFTSQKHSIPQWDECAIGLGLSGVNNPKWRDQFLNLNPGFHQIELETDGVTTLLGAHGGEAGMIIALGTGSIGMAKSQTGEIKSVSGWGYPSGDEASGSWFGIQAIRYTEKVMDGRVKSSYLSEKIQEVCGKSPEKLLDWLNGANSKKFASLAEIVVSSSKKDPYAVELIEEALKDIEEMVLALDLTQKLSFSLCGKLGESLQSYLPLHLQKRHQKARGSSLDGALMLILKGKNEA